MTEGGGCCCACREAQVRSVFAGHEEEEEMAGLQVSVMKVVTTGRGVHPGFVFFCSDCEYIILSFFIIVCVPIAVPSDRSAA